MQEQLPRQRRRPRQVQRLPRNQQRERVFRLVREHNGPIDAAAVADRMGLHVTTVRFHLDALCDDGAVTRTRIGRAGVGRPRTGYVVVRDRLDYRTLAEVLAMELGDTETERRSRAERAGYRWAGRIIENDPSAPTDSPAAAGRSIDDLTETVTEVFDRMGFAPEADPAVPGHGERSIRLYGCPVRDLAHCHPEVSCAMHLGLLRGLVGADDENSTVRAELHPLVEPDTCVARVILND